MLNKKGLIMAEALVAIATLVIATFALSTIISNAVWATATSRDYLIAQNLVTEAIEAVKNVRDTNWMLYPSRKVECWLALDPGNEDLEHCNASTAQTGYYIVNPDGGWKLEWVNPQTLLDLEDNASDESYILDENENFYRSVRFLTVDNVHAIFEVKVQWKDGAKVRTIQEKAPIFNYL